MCRAGAAEGISSKSVGSEVSDNYCNIATATAVVVVCCVCECVCVC